MLFVIENSCYGGGEKTFSLLVRGLPKDKFEIFCASRPTGRFHEEVRDGCRFLPLDLSNRIDPRNIGRLADIMRGNGIDVAHSQGARADFYCALAAARAGVKAVSTVAMPVEGFEVGRLRKKIYLALNAFAEKKITRFITLGGVLRDLLVEGHGVPPGKVDMIPNPAVLDGVPGPGDAVRGEFGLKGGSVIAAAGRLVEQKGFDILIDALELLGGSAPGILGEVKCVIAGAGPLEARLRRRAASLGNRIVFAGFRDDMRGFLSSADLFVLPSRSEGQPLVLLEAMSLAKPVLAADLPGIKEIIEDGINGVLFRTGDPAALAEKLEAILADRQAAARMGGRAAETASRFTLGSFLAAHERVYRELTG